VTSLVRRYLKTGIAVLLVGLALGAWMLARRELAGVYASPYLVSAHTHAILVGCVMLMILGVALAAGGVLLAGLAQVAGLALFFHTMWSRIRPVGSQAREQRGERF
jgi:xanthine/uracil/vitamin C permease (AzgA family)